MKKIILSLLIVTCVSYLFSSCNNKKGSGEAYTLKMRLNKGDKFGHDMDMNMKMGFQMAGKEMNMEMAIKGATAFEVLNDSNELKELKMTYTRMNVSVGIKGMETNGKMGDNDAGRKIEGKSVTLKMNNKNEIVEIAGIEEVMYGDSTTDEATREQMKKLFSKEQLNNLFGMMFQMYPDKPVRVGDSWEKETDASVSGINMKMKAGYELKSVKDGVAYVDLDGKYKGKGKLSQGGLSIEMEMDGAQKGNINIGLADGYLKDSQVTMDIKANMSLAGQKIPVTIKGYYLIKGN